MRNLTAANWSASTACGSGHAVVAANPTSLDLTPPHQVGAAAWQLPRLRIAVPLMVATCRCHGCVADGSTVALFFLQPSLPGTWARACLWSLTRKSWAAQINQVVLQNASSQALVRMYNASLRQAGLQQALISDMDGSFLGKPAQVRVLNAWHDFSAVARSAKPSYVGCSKRPSQEHERFKLCLAKLIC